MFEQPLLLLLRLAPLGDVFDSQEDQAAAAPLVADGQGIQLDRALAAMGQVALDNAGSAASVLQAMAYMGITPIIGSYAQCAETLDKFASMPGNKGIMLIFPECLTGLQEFGERVLPLMKNVKLKTAQQPEAT